MVPLSEYLAALSLTASLSLAIALRREALGGGDELSSPWRTELVWIIASLGKKGLCERHRILEREKGLR